MTKASDFGLKVARTYPKYDLCFCPFHSDKHPSASFYHESGSLYCFTCAKLFGVKDILKVTGSSSLSDEELEELLRKSKLTIHIKAFENDDDMSRVVKSFEEVALDYIVKNETEEIALDYLERRNISTKTANYFGLRISDNGIIFPQQEYIWQKIAGFVERVYTPVDKTQRYFKHGKIESAWPYKQLARPNWKYLFVTEGPFKAMRIYQMLTDAGVNNFSSVCSFGLGNKDSIENVLSFYSRKIIVIGDPDSAGRNWARSFKGRKNFYPFTFPTPFDEVNDSVGVVALKEMIEIVEDQQKVKVFDAI